MIVLTHHQLIIGSLIMVLSSTTLGCSTDKVVIETENVDYTTDIIKEEVDFNEEIQNDDDKVVFDTDMDSLIEQFPVALPEKTAESDSHIVSNEGSSTKETVDTTKETLVNFHDDVYTDEIKSLLSVVTEWEYKSIEASYIGEIDIPDSEYFRKDVYGNYIIPESVFDSMEAIYPIMINGKIPYRYAINEGSGVGEPINPMYEHYHKYRELFSMNTYWSEVNERWLTPITIPITKE